jgi:serine/threonine protein kinase
MDTPDPSIVPGSQGPAGTPSSGGQAAATEPTNQATPDGRPTETQGATAPSADSVGAPAVPLFQDRYELGTILGRGGTCTVYKAWDTRLQRHVALKRLEPPLSEDAHTRARFSREGRAIARLHHPSLVTLIDRGSTEDTEYLVFEYVEGRSLKDLVKTEGPLDPARAADIAGRVAEGLAYAHVAGIYHRDVKPQNILLDQDGRARLTDFGIATGPEWTRVTRAGAIVGSSRYMSPEQVQGRPVDGRTDVYSLGIVLYEMLAGRPPFDGSTIAEIGRQHIRAKPRPLAEIRDDLPPGLGRIVNRCLEKLPETRFQSMDELLGALVGLGYYELERSNSGVLESIKRAGMALLDPDADTATDQASIDAEGADATGTTLPRSSGASISPGTVAADPWDALAADRRQSARRSPLVRLSLVLLPLVVLAGLVAGWYLIKPAPAPLQTPTVEGKTLTDAQKAAQAAGLKIKVDSPILAPGPPGVVLRQNPKAGPLPDDGTIHVNLSRGRMAVPVVSLQDMDPQGDGTEQRDLLSALSDSNDKTFWRTELYRSPDFGAIKSGVGVLFNLK